VSAVATLVLTGILSGDEEVVAEESASDAKADSKKSDAKKKSKAPLNYVPLDPPFVVNFNADSDIRFLQIPSIRNSLVMLFSSQDPYVLNTREGKEKLRDETLTEVQKVLKDETGSTGIENVFFTSFVMQ